MAKRTVVCGWLILCLTAVACAQWQSAGAVTAITPLPNGMEVRAGAVRVRLTALSPTVVRVRFARDGNFPPDHSFAVVEKTGFSAPTVQVSNKADAAEFSTGALQVRVAKSPLRVIFLDAKGQVILQDDPKHPVSWAGTEFRVWKSMPEDEHYFALGDKAGPLDHRNLAFTNWNTDAYGYQESTDPLYKTIPFYIGLRRGAAYGVFLDNTYRSTFDFGKELRDAYSFGADGGELNYYFFYGPEPRKVVEDYTALTGRVPLPPLFALGFQQSRYSYETDARVREVASELRRRKIPADVLYLDIDYQFHNRPFTVDPQRFPDMKGLARDLGQQGFKLVLITDLHIAKADYPPYNEGLQRGYFVKNPDGSVYVGTVWPGDSVFPDFTRSEVRQWWGGLYRDFVADGVRGFWNDMNEPAIFLRADKTMPLNTVHSVEGRITDHREVHNVFGMENTCGTYQGLLRLKPDERPLVLTRAAYSGTQRCASTWTGDNSATWNHLHLSLPMLLNLGLSGFSFVGDDIGGYAGTPDPNLLTRWIEVGAFNPFFRDHTEKNSGDQEPWIGGQVHEDIARRYIGLRYQLLPYIYSEMEESSRTGVPLMRPMFLDFPNEEDLATTDTEFMFGRAFLVAPKLDSRLDPVKVALPKGDWYDFWNGRPISGGATLAVTPHLDELPVYVRAGSIIAEQAVIQHVGETPQGPLQLHVYPGPDCKGSVYADDGNSLAYQHGEFQRTAVTCEQSAAATKVNIAAPSGPYQPWWKEFEIVVQSAAGKPRSVSVGGVANSQWRFDPATLAVSVTVPAGAATEVVLQY